MDICAYLCVFVCIHVYDIYDINDIYIYICVCVSMYIHITFMTHGFQADLSRLAAFMRCTTSLDSGSLVEPSV